ncbi:MAG: ABC transporter permease [Acidobacteriaceae bacterium]|nr:ABC transporter permease [Acidobacteriaceae bacterium]
MLNAACLLVPAAQRLDRKQEWQAELWHRWQFLAHAQAWNWRESLLLIRRCMGVFPDALWHFTGQEAIQVRVREAVRSPWACLGTLCLLVAILACLTSGLPATRNLFQTGAASANTGLVFIWFHPATGGGDEGLPSDVAPAWAAHSRLLEGVAPFVIAHQRVIAGNRQFAQPLVVRTQASLFSVLRTKPLLGKFPSSHGVVLTYALWRSLFRKDPGALGQAVKIGRDWHRVAAVLPPDFHFLSRQSAAYLIGTGLPDAQQMIVGRVRPGVSEIQLDKELTQIAETACYYFFRSELRYSFLRQAAWIPFQVFAAAFLASGLLVLAVSRVPLRRVRGLLKSHDKLAMARRVLFFSSKLGLAFLIIFCVALEWSRSESAVLYASRDPAAGPFLLWLYILGTMGVLFWAVADQRARCRVCLRLLCFPVRVGCPGCLLLNWSGMELLCTEGHGLLHVPHLAPSWDEESERWISLDESWKDLFAATR